MDKSIERNKKFKIKYTKMMAKQLDVSALLMMIVVDLGIDKKTIALFYITMI